MLEFEDAGTVPDRSTSRAISDAEIRLGMTMPTVLGGLYSNGGDGVTARSSLTGNLLQMARLRYSGLFT